jgi:2-polyprenyl-3-methyl-5-hydroxy-6-metoxy-1,4-benzoquinol methylase
MDRLSTYQTRIMQSLQKPTMSFLQSFYGKSATEDPGDDLSAREPDMYALLQDVVGTAGERKLESITAEVRKKEPFLYALLHDTLKAAANSQDDPEYLKQLAESARVRIDSLQYWNMEDNDTIAAIEAGAIDPESIKPHIRLAPEAYDEFYSGQSDVMEQRADLIEKRVTRQRGAGPQRDFVEVGLGTNVNHSMRWTHAVSLVENLIGVISTMGAESEKVRWMDIGCGTGRFANAVNPARFSEKPWEIIGCDMQAGKIAVAEAQKARGRNFFASDAFAMLKSYENRGEFFDLVSMFEFLEHLDDPLKFVRRLHLFRPKFVLAASPLEQKLWSPTDTKPDRVHLWSFSRKSWEQLFELAGFEVVYTSEVRIGKYISGLDWLTTVCGPRAELHDKRKNLKAR